MFDAWVHCSCCKRLPTVHSLTLAPSLEQIVADETGPGNRLAPHVQAFWLGQAASVPSTLLRIRFRSKFALLVGLSCRTYYGTGCITPRAHLLVARYLCSL